MDEKVRYDIGKLPRVNKQFVRRDFSETWIDKMENEFVEEWKQEMITLANYLTDKRTMEIEYHERNNII